MDFSDKTIALPNGKRRCKICNKEYSEKGIYTHIWRSHGEGKDHNPNIGYKDGKREIWNKGLSKKDHEGIRSQSKKIKGREGTFLGRSHKEESKKKIGKKLSKNNKGGRCKWFLVKRMDGKEFNVQGTWERDFVKVLNIIDKDWIKIGIGDSAHTFEWKDEDGNTHHYTPDFWSPKLQKYFEIKGYWWGQDKKKMELVLEQNEIPLEIVRKKELESYLKLTES